MQTRSYWDEDLAILSSENVSFSLETAGLGSRLAALALDTLFQLLVLITVLLVALGLEEYVGFISGFGELWASILAATFYIFSFLLFFGYYFAFEWLWDGQTPGKRQFGLRVTMSDGRPLGVWSALLRNVIRVVDFLPPFYGIGSVVALVSPLNQRAGDLFAGTIVVREGRREQQKKPLSMREAIQNFLETAATLPETSSGEAQYRDRELRREDAFEETPSVDLDALNLSKKLSREDYELARDFLARREAMPKGARERLARSLAARLRGRIGEESEEFPPADEEFLSWLVGKVRGLF